jgi:hypothetical protein
MAKPGKARKKQEKHEKVWKEEHGKATNSQEKHGKV